MERIIKEIDFTSHHGPSESEFHGSIFELKVLVTDRTLSLIRHHLQVARKKPLAITARSLHRCGGALFLPH